jgi:hypothetical protein
LHPEADRPIKRLSAPRGLRVGGPPDLPSVVSRADDPENDIVCLRAIGGTALTCRAIGFGESPSCRAVATADDERFPLITRRAEPMATAGDCYRLCARVDRWLDALEDEGHTRAGVVIDLGRQSRAQYTALSVFQCLGCAVLLHIDVEGASAIVSAAAAIVAAGQGVQFLATRYPDDVAMALETWLAATREGAS